MLGFKGRQKTMQYLHNCETNETIQSNQRTVNNRKRKRLNVDKTKSKRNQNEGV